MPYGIQYKMRIQSNKGAEITVLINDTATFTTDPISPVVTDLLPSDTPIYISSVDNDDNKYRPIRAKRAILSFKSTSTVTARTFATGEDNKWLVDAFVSDTSERIFLGFLVMDDHSQAFMDPAIHYEVKLTATDNLGTLKEQQLTKTDGTNPKGPFKIIQWIAWALQKTGLQLNIVVANSWMEESYQDLPAWNNIYYDSLTFEGSEIGSCVDCLKALEIIFGYHSFIQQRNGTWWIGNVDEMTGNVTYRWTFNYLGGFISTQTPAVFSKTIGFAQPIKLMNADAIVKFTRPHKFVKLLFSYEFPKERIPNIDFSRGAVLTVVSPTETDFHMEDWTVGRYSANAITSPGATSAVAYIRRIYENGYEKERYAVVTSTFDNNPRAYVRSNPVPVGNKDRGTISVDFKYSSTAVSDHTNPLAILLKGDSGTTWQWSGGIWFDVSTVAVSTYFIFSTTYVYSSASEKTQWQSVSTTFKDAPESGDLYVLLPSGFSGTSGSYDAHYQNLRFDIDMFINGSYQRYVGHYNMLSQAGNYKANIDEEVLNGDAPRKNVKGAFLKLVSGKYVLAGRWYAGGDLTNLGITPPIGDANLHPFGWLQIYALWHQYNRRMVELSGSLYGLNYADAGGFPDLIHNYDINVFGGAPEVTHKNFMLTGMDQDSKSEKWRATLVETNDSTITRDFSTAVEFKYISDY